MQPPRPRELPLLSSGVNRQSDVAESKARLLVRREYTVTTVDASKPL